MQGGATHGPRAGLQGVVRTGAAILSLLYCAFAADGPAYEFRRGAGGSWELWRHGTLTIELPAADARFVVDLFAEPWRGAVIRVQQAPAESTDKQLYIAFLKRRYGYQIAALNQAYGLDASAFTELESMDFSRQARRVEADELAFAAEFFAGALAARPRPVLALLRPDTPPELARSLEPHTTAFAVRDPLPPPALLKQLEKPLIYLSPGPCPTVRPAFAAACLRISNP